MKRCARCAELQADAEHFQRENAALSRHVVDLMQRIGLLVEQTELQKEIITEKNTIIACGIRADELSTTALRAS